MSPLLGLMLATALVVASAAGAAQGAPDNTSLPTIAGPATAGSTLYASPGTWETPGQYETAIQWERCVSPTVCAPVLGATAPTYLVSASDAGAALRIAVTATNHWASATVYSEQTAVVPSPTPPKAPPVNTVLPEVSGVVAVGATLVTTSGSWSGSTPMEFAYQWRRCDTSGGGCLLIPDASSSSYVPTSTDLGLTLRSTVTASNADGSETAVSEKTAVVGGSSSAPVTTALPVVSGVTQVGATLTTSDGSWTGSTPMSLAYQWRRCDAAGVGCLLIPGATSSSYVPTSTDLGLTIRSTVTASNAAGSTTAVSAQTSAIAPASTAPPASTGLPEVSGVVQVGATLSTSDGSWSGSTPMSFAYQWRRCDTSGGGCLLIPGATSSSYVPASDDLGLTLRSTVTASNADGSETAVSEKTAVVAGSSAAPVNTALPVVSGVVQVGATLTTSKGSWTGSTPMSFAYQWRRCDAAGGGCLLIPGATSSSYVPTSTDLGLTVRSTVTASNTAGSATTVSVQSVAVGSASAARTSAIPGIGIHRVGASWSGASGYERYAYVVVGRASAASAAGLPGKGLVYHSGTSVNVNWDTGVPYSVALANNWLLVDASGSFLRNLAYPDNLIGDVGSTSYQAEWARRTGDYLASIGADGVYIDDVIADISTMSGGFPAKYPNQVAWENAMASFVAAVGPALKARGFYVLVSAHKFVAGNLGSNDGSLEAGWWQRLGPYVSGLHTEYWVQDGTSSRLRAVGSEWWNQWDGWQRLVAVAQGTGADFFGLTYGSSTDTRAMRYGKGSFMLDWDGGGGAFMFASTDASDPWNSAWTTDLGGPLAAKTALAAGVWLRRYELGTVVVNSTQSAVTVTVNGVARTIPATDALILIA